MSRIARRSGRSQAMRRPEEFRLPPMPAPRPGPDEVVG